MRYIATMNTPGYLPQDDKLHVFDTTGEAWRYLAGEREAGEDSTETPEGEEAPWEYSETANTLAEWGEEGHGTDVLYGPTPGYMGRHDLGIAYSVTQVERGLYRGPCCGDDVIGDVGYCCDDCQTEGCKQTEDACGEVNYWECNRTDSLADADADADDGCTCERIPGSLDYSKCAFCVDLETHCYLCRKVGHPKSEECTP
jgi:hypothetical protein